jgi:hypothetical protein
MAWTLETPLIGHQPVDEISATKQHPLGLIVRGNDPTYGSAEFIYLTGVVGTAAGAWVTYDIDGASALLVASAVGPVAIAMAANVASRYGWYMIHGKHNAALCWGTLALTSNGLIYATASAGLIDDAVVSGDLVRGAKTDEAKTTGGSTVAVEIYRPRIMNEDPTV